MQKILIIEDEKKVADVVQTYLEIDGYEVYTALNGKDGLNLFKNKLPDLIVLDLMLPDITGEVICEHVRKGSNVPIIILTAKSSIEDRINGLGLGADDYLIKPFSPKELVMRVRTVLRRTSNVQALANVLSYNNNDLKIDTIKHCVYKNDEIVNLTPVEYKILILFTTNPNRVYSRDDLIEKVLGIDFDGFDRTIDAHIKNLRKKIEDDPKNPKYIITVFGVGYKFRGE